MPSDSEEDLKNLHPLRQGFHMLALCTNRHSSGVVSGARFVLSHLLALPSLQEEGLRMLQDETPKDLWKKDPDAFMEKLSVSCVTSLLNKKSTYTVTTLLKSAPAYINIKLPPQKHSTQYKLYLGFEIIRLHAHNIEGIAPAARVQ